VDEERVAVGGPRDDGGEPLPVAIPEFVLSIYPAIDIAAVEALKR
jgi:hypothetical protein